MKKILILGGSHRDIPLIKASKELGYFCITLGDRDYYIGHRYSDKYYKVDFNDLDSVRKIIEKENINFLIPGCGEESYLNTVKLSKEYNIGNFDSLQTAKLLHDKWNFKEFCLQNDICTPKGVFLDDGLDLKSLNYPLVIKPTNLSGGRGVKVVNDILELKEELKYSKNFSSKIFLEEFIDGELYAYSIIVKNNKIGYGFLGKDDSFKNKYLISTAYKTTIKKESLQKLQADILKIIQTLNLVDGAFHIQFLLKDDKPYIIDITRRIPGDLYPYLVEYSDGVQYSKAVIKAYIGENIGDELKTTRDDFIIRHCIMSEKNGILKDVYIDKKIKNKIIYQLRLKENNSKIDNFLSEQIGIVFVKLEDYDNNIVKSINNLIKATIEE